MPLRTGTGVSLAARCPWCETVFRLTEAQISAKGGMVRCGLCGHSFNAVDALLSDAALAALEAATQPATAIPPGAAAPAPAPPAAPAPAPAPAPAAIKVDGDRPGAELPQGSSSDNASAIEPRPSAALEEAPPASAAESAAQNAKAAKAPLWGARSKPLGENRTAPVEATALAPAEGVEEEELLGPSTYHPSFMGPLDGPDVAPRRLRHALSVIVAVMLVLLLAAQASYWWRNDIAASIPESRPYLVLACHRIGCVVSPQAQIEQLSIESSELTAAPGSSGVLNFSALLRNHRDVALAYPALEVTLTDARDQAVIRRVFTPSDYLRDERRSHQDEGIAANSEFTIKLSFTTGGVATSGYRASLFYP